MSEENQSFVLNDLERRFANLVSIGAIRQADYVAARVRVEIGDILTDWIPWTVSRAGLDLEWWAPEVDEQVIVFAPAGDLGQAFVSGALYQAAFPPPASVETVKRVQFADGTVVEYDRSGGKLLIDAVGEIEIISAAKITVTASGTIDLDGLGAGVVKGSVQGDSICAFTGAPHAHISGSVKESL